MNKNIIEQFELLTNQIKTEIDLSSKKDQLKNMFRLASIQKVIKLLEKYNKKIVSSEQLKGIKGIGKKSLKRIDEILKTGKLNEIKITEDIDKYLKIINELENIFGINRKTAYKLFKEHNITSINDLKEKYEKGEIKLSEQIVKGMFYFDKIKENIPRDEITKLIPILTNATIEIDPQLFMTICGSYRREKETSNDIDIILCHTQNKKYLTTYIKLLKEKNIIVDSLTSDDVETKYMGILKTLDGILRRVDIRFIPLESYYYAILYFTGGKDFNRQMRKVAISMGYVLNEYGLYTEDGGTHVVKSEKDIFDILNMDYIQPKER